MHNSEKLGEKYEELTLRNWKNECQVKHWFKDKNQ